MLAIRQLHISARTAEEAGIHYIRGIVESEPAQRKGLPKSEAALTESAPARGVRLLHLGDRLCGRVLNRTWPSGLRLCKDLVYPLENFG